MGRMDELPAQLASDRASLVKMGLSARRLLAGEPVHRLPEEVGMAVVPRVLLDQMEQDPSQAGCPTVGPGAPGQPLQAAVGHCLRDQGAGAGHGVLPERLELLGGVLGGRVPVPVGVGLPVHRVPWERSLALAGATRERYGFCPTPPKASTFAGRPPFGTQVTTLAAAGEVDTLNQAHGLVSAAAATTSPRASQGLGQVRAGPRRRSSSRVSPGQASRSTWRGTCRPAYRNASATTTTSSSGPITGRNSGMRSIGEASHSPASTIAILARRGTRGSRRSRRTVVTQSGMNRASSRSGPGGSRRASRSSSPQPATISPTAATRPPSHSGIAGRVSEWLVDGLVDLVGISVQELFAALEVLLGVGGVGQGERVAGFEVTPPAAQALQTVLFLLQFGQGELAQPLFLGELGLVLVAVGDELGPFFLAGAGELGHEQRGGCLIVGVGVKHQDPAPGAACQLAGALDAGLECGGGGDGPDTGAERERAEVAQLPPNRDAMPGRPGR